MTPEEWDAGDSLPAIVTVAGERVSARKWRLFMAAAVRDARRHHLLPAVADACSLAERLADGLASPDEVSQAQRQLEVGWRYTELPLLLFEPSAQRPNMAAGWLGAFLRGRSGDPDPQLRWVREVVGNPFRWVRWEDEWVSPTVHQLAADAYARGRFDGLPVLADALEDAGCDNAELLAHLRGPGPHCRGCWALDVVLGKV